MNLVDNDESHEVGVTRVRGFTGNDIPLFRGGDNDLRFRDLLLRQLRITSQFSDFDAEVLESVRECVDLLLDKSLHGRNVDDLKSVPVNVASVGITELRDGSEDGESGTIGLSSQLVPKEKETVSLPFQHQLEHR
jgi:hypothetical protein